MISKPVSFFIAGVLIGVISCSLIFSTFSNHSETANSHTPLVRSLKLAHALPANHPVHQGLEYMAKRVAELSGGHLEIILFPSGQLGDETKCIEQVQKGTLAMTKTSAAPMGNFVEAFKVFSLPYLFRDANHYWDVLDGSIGKEMLERLNTNRDGNATGIVGLGYFDSGSRNFYSKTPIFHTDDMKGKKFRVMRDPVAMDMVEAMGGSPTPIPWGELYTALKQGVVDGAENNPPSIVSSRHSEISKHLTLNAHTRIPDIIIISDRIWSRLSDLEKKHLRQAMAEASAYQRELWEAATQQALRSLKEEGVAIHKIDDSSFRDAVKPVVEKHAVGEIREIYDSIQAISHEPPIDSSLTVAS